MKYKYISIVWNNVMWETRNMNYITILKKHTNYTGINIISIDVLICDYCVHDIHLRECILAATMLVKST